MGRFPVPGLPLLCGGIILALAAYAVGAPADVLSLAPDEDARVDASGNVVRSPACPRSTCVSQSPRSLTVTGSGTVYVTPNVATITYRVVTTNDNMVTASNENNEATAASLRAIRMLDTFEFLGATGTLSIRTDNLYINVNQVWVPIPVDDSPPKRYPIGSPFYGIGPGRFEEAGFRAERTVTVTVKRGNLDTIVPAIVAAIVTPSGTNRINNLTYSLTEDATHRASLDAIDIAVRYLKEEAHRIADGLDVTVGDPLAVNPLQGGVSPPMPYGMAAAKMSADFSGGYGENIDLGNPDAYSYSDIPVSESVTVTFEIIPSNGN